MERPSNHPNMGIDLAVERHFVVMQQVQQLLGTSYAELPSIVRFLLSVSLVTAISAASYYLFERRFFRLLEKKPAGEGPG